MKKHRHYADKHEKNLIINPDIAEKVKIFTSEGKLPCAVAFKIAGELDAGPREVGITLDLLEIKISRCQLGIFGYGTDNKPVKPAKDIPVSLANIIRDNLTEGKLACSNAWKIADSLGIGRMDVTSACDNLEIKISQCQLGAF